MKRFSFRFESIKRVRELARDEALKRVAEAQDAYDLLHKIYKVRGDYKQALDMYEKCWDIKFGGINSERNAQNAASESNFIKLVDEKEKLEKQAQIAELEE